MRVLELLKAGQNVAIVPLPVPKKVAYNFITFFINLGTMNHIIFLYSAYIVVSNGKDGNIYFYSALHLQVLNVYFLSLIDGMD